MKRFLAAAAALLLMTLGSQVVLAQYQVSGTLSCGTAGPGGDVTVSDGGFAPVSPVQITIEPTPVLLATVTTDASGAFSTTVSIPAASSGEITISATGTDPAGSVRVLSCTITVIAGEVRGIEDVPATNTGPETALLQGSDPIVFALAGAGIVLMTGLLLLGTRTRRSRR